MRARGFTTVELLVATAIGLLVLAGLSACYAAAARFYARVMAAAEQREALSLALATIVRDLRQAGYDPRRTGLVGLARARRTEIVLVADLDGDGRVDPRSREKVAYRRGPRGSVQRVVGRQSMPLTGPLHGIIFAYVDGDGHELVLAPELEAAARARVRAVRVWLLPPRGEAPLSVTVALRNLDEAA